MRLLDNPQYQKDLETVGEMNLPWKKLKKTAILLSGATGMIGHFLIDVIMYRNRVHQQECAVYAMGRTEDKAVNCFREYWNHSLFHFVQWDIQEKPEIPVEHIDYLFHLASTTHPIAYATEPIDTIMVNIAGLQHMLEAALQYDAKRVIFTSSCEIYGEQQEDMACFTEESCGYINCNTLRAGYPESKRTGESLCQAYIHQFGMDIVIPRLSRTYGPTMQLSDSKAIAQFIKKAVNHEDIVLKSEGNQLYSYSHVADAVAGILYCLLLGRCGEAYNIASSSIRLKELAEIAADTVGCKVVFELPDATEKVGYSKASRSVLDTHKLCALGWIPQYDTECGVRETVQILSGQQ